ncbi:MAG: type II secretion system protein [Planctomycetes bacterium]|nr:type II secretion system protein [Planctomycetota bacterium]
MRPTSAIRRHGGARFPRAFTLIEMLVVIAIILILLGSVLVAGNSIINRTKIRNTRAVLLVVDAAIDEFHRQKPSIIGARQNQIGGGKVRYSKRYGGYPPDEVEMFTVSGLPNSAAPPIDRSLSVGQAEFHPAPTGGKYTPMKFYTRGNPESEIEHRDLLAMVLAIDMYCEPAAMLLARVPDGNRWKGLFDPNGDPLQFLEDANAADQKWNPVEDRQLPFGILDSWGQPLSYMAQRDYTGTTSYIPSNNAVADWNRASTEMIRLNNGRPIIMSWGPDGEDQLTQEAQQDPTASLVGDWDDNNKIDNPFNEDNVFADDTLNKKLAEGP